MGLLKFFANFDNNRSLKKLEKIAAKIEALDEKYSKMSNEELQGQTQILKNRVSAGETLDDVLPEAFATVREAAFRVLKKKHYHVQLLGGIVLHEGRISEMKTGEGKTLVSTLPAYLNALGGKPVHIVTVNEYLAKRDAEWMGKVHKFLGLSVGVVYSNQNPAEKAEAYKCDITYGTSSEFGFDYLRDNMAPQKKFQVMRGLDFCIIDEVDSVLIDEARTPLIISGPTGESSDQYVVACNFVKTLKKDDVEIDEQKKTIHLTDSGITKAEKFYKIDNLSDVDNLQINHNINNAIRARFMMKRDNDYIVKDGEVLIVDEFTGRIMVGRRYSDGLHQAIEAKEGVKINEENKTQATITLQNFFKLYKKLSGMTGTAKTEESEFREIYGLDVVTIPSNKPVIRKDANDIFYFSHQAKIRAICEDIKDCYERKQPVLVGTITVEKSEELSKALKKLKIPHNVLNAKNHLKEAEIIAQAGKLGAVTIATNMAGRGTDILLGGNPEFMAKEAMRKKGYEPEMIELASSFFPVNTEEEIAAREEYSKFLEQYTKVTDAEKQQVVALGGLRIIGTERHESRRIDNQLRGRSGRQGDPGSSVFYISADDDLSRVFGSERLKRMAEIFKLDEDMSINWKMFSRNVENAQKRVEGFNYSARKNIIEYDNVLNQQRAEVYAEREKILEGEDIHANVLDMIRDLAVETVGDFDYEDAEKVDIEDFNKALEQFLLDPGTNYITLEVLNRYSHRELIDQVAERAVAKYESRYEQNVKNGFVISQLERDVFLRNLDRRWIEHIDDMDNLKMGIGLRGYANKNPVIVYQEEGSEMFEEMIMNVRKEVAKFMLALPVLTIERHNVKIPGTAKPNTNLQTHTNGKPAKPKTIVNKTETVGRNDPCPCGSGKKYKNCCGKQQ
ncbi:MAG: preprotein translocase subunit SecA [Clostridia bacterium]|nr:preprotein translocase subunit SecA [Clostridia bacterium]